MKKFLLSLVILLSVLATSAQTFKYYRVTGGANVTVPLIQYAQLYYVYSSGATAVNTDYNLVFASTPPVGSHWKVYYDVTSSTLGVSRTFNFFGTLINGYEATVEGWVDYEVVNDHTNTPVVKANRGQTHINESPANPTVRGDAIIDATIDYATKLIALPAGHFILGDAGNTPIDQPLSGDVTCNDAGVTAIGAGVIVNADVNASAAIAWTKLAAGTASYPMTTNGSGYPTTEQYILPTQGGTGMNTTASTGVATVSAGTWAVGARTESQTFSLSFDTTSIGDVKVLFPYACTVTGFYAEVTKTIQSFNDGTITPKNNAGTGMTSGVITVTAGTTIGTGFTSTPSANNVFTAGQIMTLTVAKANAGGTVLLTVTYTRTN